MPMFAFSFGVVISDYPFALDNINQRIFKTVRLVQMYRNLPYFNLNRIPLLVSGFAMVDKGGSHVGMKYQH